ncbi:MAG: family 10 glycosylhydrolase [Paludibacteraceae bacterium]|nr:family 10 glycosylhydrolase [Paludibacteraceae bacterium]
MKRLLLTLAVCGSCLAAIAQPAVVPKRELRAAWIASVANIDWPSREAVGHSVRQQQELCAMLDTLQALHMNAVVFQIRPTADAFYYSELEPLSHWLTGAQGIDNDVSYDPLAFAVREAHKRLLDVHVWLNPYRVTNSKNAVLDSLHIMRQHPEWFVCYGDKWYFDPGRDETRRWLNSVVADIVSRYDVDAVHFDDYFYPYRIPKKEFPDSASFADFPRGYTDKDAWRRHNVDMVIEELQHTIKSLKPWVEFGISPFGVWRNRSADPERGSLTQAGCQNYDDLYADILLWLERGWIDYVAPQLYWEIGKRVADYEVLARWWAQYAYGRNLYIGHAPYQLGNRRGAEAWRQPNEICRQIALNRTIEGIEGSVYFSMQSLMANRQGLCDSLRNCYYRYPALPPVCRNIEGPKASMPQNARMEGHLLSWESGDAATAQDNTKPAEGITTQVKAEAPAFYVVYGFPIGSEPDFDNPAYIIGRTRDTRFELDEPDRYETVCITAVNRYKQESLPCILPR